MNDAFAACGVVILSLVVTMLSVAWFVVLPTVGLLYLCGYLN